MGTGREGFDNGNEKTGQVSQGHWIRGRVPLGSGFPWVRQTHARDKEKDENPERREERSILACGVQDIALTATGRSKGRQ